MTGSEMLILGFIIGLCFAAYVAYGWFITMALIDYMVTHAS